MLRLDAEGERLVNEGTYQDIINKINAMAGSMRVVHGDLVQMFVIALINNGNDWMALKLFNHFKHRYSDAGYQKRQILLLAACLGRLDTLRRLFRCGFKYTSPTISDLPGSLLKAAIIGMTGKYINYFPYQGIAFTTRHDEERLQVVKLLIEKGFLEYEARPERLLFTSHTRYDARIAITLLDAGLDPYKPVGGKHRPATQSFDKHLRAFKHLPASVVVLNHIARTTTLFSVMRKRVDLQSSSVPSREQRQRCHYPRYH